MPNHVTNVLSVDQKDTAVIEALLNEKGELDFEKIVPMPKIFERFGGGIPFLDSVLYDEFHCFIQMRNINSPKGEKINFVVQQVFLGKEPVSLTKGNNTALTESEVENLTTEFFDMIERLPEVYHKTHRVIAKSGEFRDNKVALTNELVCLALTGEKDPLSWARKYWGTKWNGYDETINDDKTSITFDTAWTSPFELIKALSKKFPTAEISVNYADEDLGSNCGYYLMLNGEIMMGENSDNNDGDWMEFASQLKFGMSYQEFKEEWGE